MDRNNFRDRRNEWMNPGVSPSGYFPFMHYSNPFSQQPLIDEHAEPSAPPQTAVPGVSPSGYFPSMDYSNPFPQQPQRNEHAEPSAPPLSTFLPPPPSYSNTTPYPYPGSGFFYASAASSQKEEVYTHSQLPTEGQFSYIQVPTHRASEQYAQMRVSQMSSVCPPERASKKALIIGCNYCQTPDNLKGCIADAQKINYMLQTQFGFKKENIRILTDDGKHYAMPTKFNIFSGMDWLVSDLLPGDSLFFHFSGHGEQEKDPTGDERDGLNETLLPCDHAHNGQIIDDDVNERLVNRLPPDVYLHAVIDACHSGTAMDLKYYAECEPGSNLDWRYEGSTKKFKGTEGGVAILFSACADDQKARDTARFTGNVYTGAATYAFIQAIVNHGRNSTYAKVLQHMRTTVEQMSSSNGPSHATRGMITGASTHDINAVPFDSPQTPQISCSRRINLNERLHI